MEFTGEKIPFGARISYIPNIRKRDNAGLPFLPKTEEGVFFGYHLNSLGDWTGDYLVASLVAFRGVMVERKIDPQKINIHPDRTARVITERVWEFPLKACFDGNNKQLTKTTVAETDALPAAPERSAGEQAVPAAPERSAGAPAPPPEAVQERSELVPPVVPERSAGGQAPPLEAIQEGAEFVQLVAPEGPASDDNAPHTATGSRA